MRELTDDTDNYGTLVTPSNGKGKTMSEFMRSGETVMAPSFELLAHTDRCRRDIERAPGLTDAQLPAVPEISQALARAMVDLINDYSLLELEDWLERRHAILAEFPTGKL